MDRHDIVHIHVIGKYCDLKLTLEVTDFIFYNRTYNADALSPDNSMNGQQPTPVPRMGTANMTLTSSSATPTMQQRIKSIGVATPLAVSSPVRR